MMHKRYDSAEREEREVARGAVVRLARMICV